MKLIRKAFSINLNFKKQVLTRIEEKTFKCEICQKVFPEISNSDIRVKAYTGKKSFNCKISQKPFTQKYHLNRHLLTHHAKFVRKHFLAILV